MPNLNRLVIFLVFVIYISSIGFAVYQPTNGTNSSIPINQTVPVAVGAGVTVGFISYVYYRKKFKIPQTYTSEYYPESNEESFWEGWRRAFNGWLVEKGIWAKREYAHNTNLVKSISSGNFKGFLREESIYYGEKILRARRVLQAHWKEILAVGLIAAGVALVLTGVGAPAGVGLALAGLGTLGLIASYRPYYEDLYNSWESANMTAVNESYERLQDKHYLTGFEVGAAAAGGTVGGYVGGMYNENLVIYEYTTSNKNIKLINGRSTSGVFGRRGYGFKHMLESRGRKILGNGMPNNRINQIKQLFGLNTDREVFSLIGEALEKGAVHISYEKGTVEHILTLGNKQLIVVVSDSNKIITVIPKVIK